VHSLERLRPVDLLKHFELREERFEIRSGQTVGYAADASGEQPSFRAEGLLFSLLGTADPATLRGWFAGLSDGGRVIDDLQRRPWGASDGQVIDRFGLHWLVGFEGDATA